MKEKDKNPMTIMTTITSKITPRYLAGLIETDGSFHLFFSGNNLKPVIKVAQKSNTNLLAEVSKFLQSHNITFEIKRGQQTTPENKGRASELVVSGKNNVSKLLNLFAKNSSKESPFVFTGVKQRDFMIMQTILWSEKPLTLAQQLGFKKSLHKSNQDEPDFDFQGSVPRNQYEKRFGLTQGQSIKDCKKMLESIDNDYKKFQENLNKCIQNKSLKVPADFVAGVIDGDGYYGVSMRVRANNNLDWEPQFQLVVDIRSTITLAVIFYAFNVKGSLQSTASSVTRRCRSERDLKTLVEYHKKFPLIGDLRQKQLEQIQRLFEMKANGQIKSYKVVEAYVREMYMISDLSKKGRRRTLTLDESLATAARILGPNS
jgi:hypothetical protein